MPIPSGYTSGQVVQAVPSLSAYAVTSSTRPATPFDGQIISETDTDSLKVYNGTSWIGVGGLVPVVPTSVAVGSGTASVGASGLITFTTVGTSLSVNGCFSATYLNYAVVFNATHSTEAGDSMNVKFRASGSDTSTEYYYNIINYYSNSATIDYLRGNNQATGILTDAIALERGMRMDILNPFAAKNSFIMTQVSAMTSTRSTPSFSYNAQNSTTSFDGFTLLPQAGTMTGTMSIYGYAR